MTRKCPVTTLRIPGLHFEILSYVLDISPQEVTHRVVPDESSKITLAVLISTNFPVHIFMMKAWKNSRPDEIGCGSEGAPEVFERTSRIRM